MTTTAEIRKLTERFRVARTIDEQLDLAREIRIAADAWEPPKTQTKQS